MMHYMDTTFCNGANGTCAKFDTCIFALTDKVQADAKMWWGAENAPIAQYSNPERLECYEPKQKETK